MFYSNVGTGMRCLESGCSTMLAHVPICLQFIAKLFVRPGC